MKKGLKIVLSIIGLIVILIIIDIIAIFMVNRPIFAIKTDDVYRGILYDTYNCEGSSMPVVKMKFTKYACVKENKKANKKVKNIVDKSKDIKDFACAEALENFYTDDEYRYYYSCIKSSYIVVIYEDGSEETVSEALEAGRIKISDLDTYGIQYYRYGKDE